MRPGVVERVLLVFDVPLLLARRVGERAMQQLAGGERGRRGEGGERGGGGVGEGEGGREGGRGGGGGPTAKQISKLVSV